MINLPKQCHHEDIVTSKMAPLLDRDHRIEFSPSDQIQQDDRWKLDDISNEEYDTQRMPSSSALATSQANLSSRIHHNNNHVCHGARLALPLSRASYSPLRQTKPQCPGPAEKISTRGCQSSLITNDSAPPRQCFVHSVMDNEGS